MRILRVISDSLEWWHIPALLLAVSALMFYGATRVSIIITPEQIEAIKAVSAYSEFVGFWIAGTIGIWAFVWAFCDILLRLPAWIDYRRERDENDGI